MQLEEQGGPDSGASAPPVAAALSATPDAASAEDVLYPEDQPFEAEPNSEEKAPADESAAKAEVYDLQMPEGVQLDRDMLTTAMPVFRDAGISRDQAQKLIPLVPQLQQRLYDQQEDDFAVVRKEWATAAKQDREIGGEHMKETQRLVGLALKAGGAASTTHEMRELMNASGLGNHPSVLRVFRRLGQIIEGHQRKDELAKRQRPASREEALYPDDQPRR